MENDNSAGSYAFNTFDEDQKELKRLMFQAQIVSKQEKEILKNAGLKKGMNVLDLACGPGVVSTILAETVEDGRVTGIDISSELLEVAKDYSSKKGIENIEFMQGDVYNLELEYGVYDFIYARFLFQHLKNPLKALESIKPLLKEGGTLCLLDIDDGWLSIHPEPEGFGSFTSRAAKGQNSYGGDRQIGRKLGTYMHGVDLKDVDVAVETFSSKQLGMKNFLDITTGFKKEQVPKDELLDAMIELESIYKVIDLEEAMGYVACFIATAKR